MVSPYCSFFYVLILPYLNLLFDELLKYSLLKRNTILINKQKQNIENQKQIAIEEIKLEEAKTEFRERNTHNKLVEDLQKRNKDLEIESNQQKERNKELIDQLRTELSERDKITSTQLTNFERRYSESRHEIMELTDKIFKKDQEIQELKSELNERRLYSEERPTGFIIRFDNGIKIEETYDGNKKVYYNREYDRYYEQQEVENLMRTRLFEKYPI